MNTTNSIELALSIEENRKTIANIYGSQWPEIVAEQRPLIDDLMIRMKATNPLSLIAKLLRDTPNDSDGPLLLAVAAEIVIKPTTPKPCQMN